MLPSASGLARALLCAPSAASPGGVNVLNEYADRGTGAHDFLTNVQKYGREKALELVPADAEWTALCEAIDLESLPPMSLSASAAEVAFRYNLTTDTAKEVGRNIGRAYPPGKLNDDVDGTIDYLSLLADGETVFIVDWKFGRGWVPRARDNAQLKFAALAACRAYGRSRAQVAITRISEDGTPWNDKAVFEAFDLDSFADDLKALHTRVVQLRAEIQAGAVPAVTMGPHCKYCPAQRYCPGVTSIVREVASAPEHWSASFKDLLTPETATLAYIKVRQVETALKIAKEGLALFARENPIDLGDGNVYGYVAGEETEINAEKAFDVLATKYGVDVAKAAMTFETSKAGVERAARIVVEAARKADKKLTIKTTKDEALTAIEAVGGITKRAKQTLKEHKRKAG